MRAFAAGEIDVLVSTTVIEVGVDVANATTMVLLDADRFGISQLHQLRGRVGRGGLPGLCLLVSRAEAGSPARERLDAVAGHHRRLRAEPGRPRAAPRGRRARPLPVRLPVDPAEPPGAARRGDDPRRARGRRELLDAEADLGPPPLREAVEAWSSRPRASSSRSPRSRTRGRAASLRRWSRSPAALTDASETPVCARRRLASTRLDDAGIHHDRHSLVSRLHDTHHRRHGGGPAARDPVGTDDPADDRPGARGAVLEHRVLVRVAPGAPLPRPLRRLRRGRARGVVARRRRGHARRVRPAHRAADRRQRPGARASPRPTSWPRR